MKQFKKAREILNKLEPILFEYVFPLIGAVILLLVNTPIGGIFNIKPSNDLQISLLVFFTSMYGAKLISSLVEKENQKTMSLLSQEGLIEEAFKNLPSKGGNAQILIYTSFSVFHNLQKLIQKYPQINKSSIQILLRDPDIKYPFKNNSIGATRKKQINLALDNLKAQKNLNPDTFDVRFYSNEPWVRGIKVEDKHLYYSTYSNKKENNNIIEDAFSGTNIPWIYLSNENKKISLEDQLSINYFINGFTSLFNLIWSYSSTSKTLVLDLDGTLFTNFELSKYLKDILPFEYFQYKKCTAKNMPKIKTAYYDNIKSGKSSTESIQMAMKSICNIDVDLNEYLNWKDVQTDKYALNLNKDPHLVAALKSAKNNYKLVLLTNHTRKFTEKILEQLGCAELFGDDIITISELGHAKPNNTIVNFLINKYAIDLSRTVFVGDRQEVDLDYVKNYCLGTVLVRNPAALIRLLNDFWLPFTWIYSNASSYLDVDIFLRNKELI